MNILYYYTAGGKNVIKNYIDNLEKEERIECEVIFENLEKNGLSELEILNTRKIIGKVYEIKISKNRFMYVIYDEQNMYVVHACRKVKQKLTERDKQVTIKRIKEIEKQTDKKFLK